MTHINKEAIGEKGGHIEQILKVIEDRGRPALETARKAISEEKIQNTTVHKAINHYIQNLWFDLHHAGLLSIACEAVGGNPNKTTRMIGAATILLRGGIDIHDDIIDQQKVKTKNPTIYGKYGENIAILAGNALLFKGFALLNEATISLSKEKRKMIIGLIKSAFFEIGDAVANEIQFRKNPSLLSEDYYMNVIKKKAVGTEVHMKVGGIVGGGTEKEIEVLARFGRILGILATVRDEVVDMYEPNELLHRMEYECLPLPILCAFKSHEAKEEINSLLRKKKITQMDVCEILDVALNSKDYRKVKEDIETMVNVALNNISEITNQEIEDLLRKMVTLPLADI